jgi:predicted DNA-binding ribbon-helix-helix protein
MQSKLSKNDQFSGKNNYLFTQKGQVTGISPDGESKGKVRKKTESITFRLESQILDNLRQEAKRKDVSVNTLVSQIARQHTSWHSMAAQAGFISVRKPLITKLLEGRDDEQIRLIARYVAESSNKDFILMLRMKYNIHSALDVIETWVRISGYSYTHNIEDLDYSNRAHTFLIHHDTGRNWSLYLAELYKNLFEEFEVRNAQFELTDTTLVFEVVVSTE